MFQNYLFLSTLFRLIPLGFIAFLAFPQPLSAQEFMRQGQRWMIGWQLGFFYVKAKEPYPSEQEYNLLLLESYLDIGYFVNKKLMLGSRAGLAFKASGNAMDFPDLYHLGYFSRYYPFEGDEGMNMEASFCEKCVTFRIRPYLQLSHIFTNSQIRQGKNIGLDHLGVQRVGAFAGFSTRLRNNLFFDLGAGVRYSSNSDESFFIENISSLEYFFGYSKKKENQNRPDCNATLAGSMFACKKEKRKRRERKNKKNQEA